MLQPAIMPKKATPIISPNLCKIYDSCLRSAEFSKKETKIGITSSGISS